MIYIYIYIYNRTLFLIYVNNVVMRSFHVRAFYYKMGMFHKKPKRFQELKRLNKIIIKMVSTVKREEADAKMYI